MTKSSFSLFLLPFVWVPTENSRLTSLGCKIVTTSGYLQFLHYDLMEEAMQV
jgi:hypothetical protein